MKKLMTWLKVRLAQQGLQRRCNYEDNYYNDQKCKVGAVEG